MDRQFEAISLNHNEQDQQLQQSPFQPDNNQQKINEVQILEGVYFTDYRTQNQKQSVSNLQQQSCYQQMIRYNTNKNTKYDPSSINNVLLLETDFKNFENEINHFRESIDSIKEEENWEDDKDFIDAIQENYSVIERMLDNMYNIILQIQTLDPGNKLTSKINQVEDEKNKNLKQEQQFYQYMDEYKEKKYQELQDQLGDNSNDNNNANNNKEGIYL